MRSTSPGSAAAGVDVTGLAPAVAIRNQDPGDQLAVHTLAGADSFDTDGLEAGVDRLYDRLARVQKPSAPTCSSSATRLSRSRASSSSTSSTKPPPSRPAARRPSRAPRRRRSEARACRCRAPDWRAARRRRRRAGSRGSRSGRRRRAARSRSSGRCSAARRTSSRAARRAPAPPASAPGPPPCPRAAPPRPPARRSSARARRRRARPRRRLRRIVAGSSSRQPEKFSTRSLRIRWRIRCGACTRAATIARHAGTVAAIRGRSRESIGMPCSRAMRRNALDWRSGVKPRST